MDKQIGYVPFSGMFCQVTADDPKAAINASPFEIGSRFRVKEIRCSLVTGTANTWNVEAITEKITDD